MRLSFYLATVLSVGLLDVSAHSLSGPGLGLGQLLYRRHGDIDARISARASRHMNALHRRQAPSSSPSPPAPSTSTTTTNTPTNSSSTDPKSWESQTAAACQKAIVALNGQSLSQSGIAVCYNLPSFDNSTGAFKADLRLYRVAPAQGRWAGIADADITIGLSYTGASVSDNNQASRKVKRDGESTRLNKRASDPVLLQSINFEGQLNASFLNMPMNLTQLVTLLAPNVTLSASSNAENTTLSTTLTSQEASFVNGIFAGSSVGAASLESSRPTPFVMPGRKLGVFPVGLVVTATWALLGVGVMTWGTVGRYQYRKQYRRRKMRERVAGLKRQGT